MLRLRKLMQVACTATVALTVFSCSQDEFEMTNGKGNTTITATFEGAGGNTRTTVNDLYQIVWKSPMHWHCSVRTILKRRLVIKAVREQPLRLSPEV